MENKKRNEIDGKNVYYRISGRSILHKSDCIYVRNAKREIIQAELPENADRICRCKRCCAETKDAGKEEYFVVLDLEMCRVPDYRYHSFRHKHETIQIGAVMFNGNYEIISEFSTFVRPEFGILDNFISNLTGITETQLNSAPLMKDAIRLFYNWMDQRVTKIYAWSDSDFHQLSFEVNAKGLCDEEGKSILALSWIDYQEIFDHRFSMNRRISLEEALNLSEINAEGRLHDGLDDAVNTARLIQKLEKNPEYQLSVNYVEARKEKTTSLKFSLGEMFSSVFSQFQIQEA